MAKCELSIMFNHLIFVLLTINCLFQAACAQFLKLFQHLHKFLIFDGSSNTYITENSFLCVSQILCSIRYLEKALVEENTSNIVMTVSYNSKYEENYL